jgi:hypothetical protein
VSRLTPAQADYQRQLDERARLKATALFRDEPMLSTREIAERCNTSIANIMLWEANL